MNIKDFNNLDTCQYKYYIKQQSTSELIMFLFQFQSRLYLGCRKCLW